MKRVFTGFGFGPIQAGLFVKEAFESNNFSHIYIAEVDARLVAAIRNNHGRYYINVATAHGIEQVEASGVTLLNPAVPEDAVQLHQALTQSSEIVTSLPSVDFYTRGEHSVAAQLAAGLQAGSTPVVIYTAENNNHAAEILSSAVTGIADEAVLLRPWQALNTVIGKMSQVITDPAEIRSKGLRTMVPGFDKAFLVEEFNRILVSRITLDGFKPGIPSFVEKDDLLPFEEAKLYGHNAIHTLLGFLAAERQLELISDLRAHEDITRCGEHAFIDECGAALIKRYHDHNDPLFTPTGFAAYAHDLIQRMLNPWLADSVARATRDPIRKLGYNDRIFGTIRMCLSQGITPVFMIRGAWAGLRSLANNATISEPQTFAQLSQATSTTADLIKALQILWGNTCTDDEFSQIAHTLLSTK